jgi:hypothetical protein
MPDDDRILKSLEQDFKPLDRKYASGELRVFGMFVFRCISSQATAFSHTQSRKKLYSDPERVGED